MPVINHHSITSTRQPQADYIRLQELLALCVARWRWFILSILVAIGLATIYLLITPPVFTRQASLLIKEESKKNDFSAEIGSFAEMGIFTNSINVNNELTTIQSPDLLKEVIQRLSLNVSYQTDGFFHQKTLYGEMLPVKVEFKELGDYDFCSLTLSLQEGDKVLLSDCRLNGEILGGEPIKLSYDKEVKTPLGILTVSRTPYYKQSTENIDEIHVSRSTLSESITACQKKMTASLNGEKTTIIDIAYNDVNIQRAEDFLNTLITVYNEKWVMDKNRVAVGTSQFIDERLQVIEDELGHVDSEISSYKSTHLIPNVDAASQLNMNTANQASVKISDLNNQLSIAKFIKDQMNSDKSMDRLLPANSGLDSPTIEQLIKAYNDKLLERNSLVASSSTQNPLVTNLDKNLSLMRQAILHSLDNEVSTLNTQIRGLRTLEGVNTSRLSSNPKQSKYLLSVERQQKVKEALYLFLLQKREENGLSQAFTAYNTRVITTPSGEMKPTAPARGRILLSAFFLGLLIPVIVIYIWENIYTKVRGRKDLEKLTIPFIGEIPYYGRKHLLGGLGLTRKTQERTQLVVHPKSRNVINEAFRVVRTNMEFVGDRDHSNKVVMVTSMNPGSGKTFITINLAACFAVKGSRVIVLDLDMRRASLSAYVQSPQKGLSDFLNGNTTDWRQMVVPVKEHDNLHVLPVGYIPPNPSELLSSPRLQQLIDELRQAFDLIFIDTPPVEMVADTKIIAQWTDQTIFVVRSKLMEREMLPVVEQYYQDGKFNDMLLMLNGTTATRGRYGHHRYSFHYGYGYGYGRYGGYSKD